MVRSLDFTMEQSALRVKGLRERSPVAAGCHRILPQDPANLGLEGLSITLASWPQPPQRCFGWRRTRAESTLEFRISIMFCKNKRSVRTVSVVMDSWTRPFRYQTEFRIKLLSCKMSSWSLYCHTWGSFSAPGWNLCTELHSSAFCYYFKIRSHYVAVLLKLGLSLWFFCFIPQNNEVTDMCYRDQLYTFYPRKNLTF